MTGKRVDRLSSTKDRDRELDELDAKFSCG